MDRVRGLDPVEMRAWRALVGAFKELWDTLDAELRAAHDLTLADYEVLLFLEAAPDHRLKMTALAERLHLSPSGLTRRLDGLVRAGAVTRMRCATDARSQFAVLTDAGLDRLHDAAPTHVRGVRAHFVDLLSRAQLEQLAGALEGVATACTLDAASCGEVRSDEAAPATSGGRRGRAGGAR